MAGRIRSEKRSIPSPGGTMTLRIARPANAVDKLPGVLWIHGGGYIIGMSSMLYFSRAIDLVRQGKAVAVSPEYRLAHTAPYPAAAEDCYAALKYMKEHAEELGIRDDQLFVGGESAGGGLLPGQSRPGVEYPPEPLRVETVSERHRRPGAVLCVSRQGKEVPETASHLYVRV